jgi:hypothetical protein
MLDAASAFATQALTVLAVMRAVKMATPEQMAKGPHRNDVLLRDSHERERRLEECAAAQKVLRTHLGRIRLLFGPTSPAALDTDSIILCVRDMLTAAIRYYENAVERPQDIADLSRKYGARFVNRRQDAWDSFDSFCRRAREEMGYKGATPDREELKS